MIQNKIYAVLLALSLGLTTAAMAQVGNNSGVLNPNQASAEELAALPHVDKALAEKIIAARPHLGMAALNTLLGETLSEEQRKELYVKLFLPINLNTASNAVILMVPGVGKRMAHEFDEYRPYKAIAQFRREIAKYVDDTELARLEQYVFVPINLNTASDEDILSIPGMGKRMLHEFKEYRPYKAMAQFQREIGKYVDKNEVARFERYVTID